MPNRSDYQVRYADDRGEDTTLDHIHNQLAAQHPDLATMAFSTQYLVAVAPEKTTDVLKAVHQAINGLDQDQRTPAGHDYAAAVFEPINDAFQQRFQDPADPINNGDTDYRRAVVSHAIAHAEHTLGVGIADPRHNPDNWTRSLRNAAHWASAHQELDPRTEDYAARQYAGLRINEEYSVVRQQVGWATPQSAEQAQHQRARDAVYLEIIAVKSRETLHNPAVAYDETHIASVVAQARHDADKLDRAYNHQAIYDHPPDHQPVEFPGQDQPSSDLAAYVARMAAAFPELQQDWPALTRNALFTAIHSDDSERLQHARHQAAVMHTMAYGVDPTEHDQPAASFQHLDFMRNLPDFPQQILDDLAAVQDPESQHQPAWLNPGHPDQYAIIDAITQQYPYMTDMQHGAASVAIADDMTEPTQRILQHLENEWQVTPDHPLSETFDQLADQLKTANWQITDSLMNGRTEDFHDAVAKLQAVHKVVQDATAGI